MRRLVLEFPFASLEKSKGGTNIYQKIELIETLHLLRQSRDGYDAVCRVTFKNPSKAGVSALLSSGSITDVQFLYRESKESYVVYLKGKPSKWMTNVLGPAVKKAGVYMYGLFELRDGTLKAAYLGNSSQILHFLRQLVKSKIDHKILSLADARFSSNSPLGALTEKQRRVLLSAFKLGYFEIPRKIGFARMSRQMNLGRSTVNEHLRKAESHLISQILVQ